MFKRSLLTFTLLLATAGFGQVTNPLGGMVDAMREQIQIKMQQERLRMEAENLRSLENLRNAQAEAIRVQTEAIRLETERLKIQNAAPPTLSWPAPFVNSSPSVPTKDAEILSVATRIRMVKTAWPSLARYTDAELETALDQLAFKVETPAK